MIIVWAVLDCVPRTDLYLWVTRKVWFASVLRVYTLKCGFWRLVMIVCDLLYAVLLLVVC